MRSQVTGRFLATIAASATSMAAVDAMAADPGVVEPEVIDSRITLAFEGAVFLNNQSDDDEDLDKLGDSDGDLYGAVSLTKKVSPDIDWRLSGAYHAGKDNSFDLVAVTPDGTGVFSADEDFDFQTVDFDMGKHIQMANTDVRLFGGLRFMHVRETFGFNGTTTTVDPNDKSGTFDKVGSSEFYGIGPRIGAEGYHALGDRWGLTGAVSGSAVWGRRNQEFSFDSVSNDADDPDPQPQVVSIDTDRDSTEVITNLSLSGGVTFMPTDNTALTAGYRLDHYNNLRSLTADDSVTYHGPFLRFEVKL